jgi:hypothetical protein
MDNANGYVLTSKWFNFAAENSEKVECKHTATYLYIVEQFNKRNWVEVIGLPTDFTMTVLNIGSYKTYKKVIEDLIEFGFIKLVEKAKNQNTSNKIGLVKNTKADAKAIPKHIPKQVESEYQSTSSIDKLLNIETIKLINNHAALIDSNLSKWIKQEIEDSLPENEKESAFDLFWSKYPVKSSKANSKKKFLKLSKSDIETILATIDSYVAYKPFESYRHPNPETYLNQRRWEDELKKEEFEEHEELTPEQIEFEAKKARIRKLSGYDF